jgi:hypothetical protein
MKTGEDMTETEKICRRVTISPIIILFVISVALIVLLFVVDVVKVVPIHFLLVLSFVAFICGIILLYEYKRFKRIERLFIGGGSSNNPNYAEGTNDNLFSKNLGRD